MNCLRTNPIQGFPEHSDERFVSIGRIFWMITITINCQRVEFVHFPFGFCPSLSFCDLKLVKVLYEHREEENLFIIIITVVLLMEPGVKSMFVDSYRNKHAVGIGRVKREVNL
jgi:hypothetical protein